MTAAGGASPADAEHAEQIRILAEPDPIKRARNCFAFVGELGNALDGLPDLERSMALIDGRYKRIAGDQRVHVELAAASAQLAIAEELRAIRELLDERLRRPT